MDSEEVKNQEKVWGKEELERKKMEIRAMFAEKRPHKKKFLTKERRQRLWASEINLVISANLIVLVSVAASKAGNSGAREENPTSSSPPSSFLFISFFLFSELGEFCCFAEFSEFGERPLAEERAPP